VLFEFGPELRVEAIGPKGSAAWSMAELLPAAFGPDHLS
jgi:hypothetical protein